MHKKMREEQTRCYSRVEFKSEIFGHKLLFVDVRYLDAGRQGACFEVTLECAHHGS